MIIIKIGGNMVNQLSEPFYQQLKSLQNNGEQILIVHGGGNLISTCDQFIGQITHKINGIRITNKSTIKISELVLNQIVQPHLNELLSQHDIQSVMLNQNGQSFLHGDYLNQSIYGEVGQVTHVENSIKQAIDHKVGILSPLAMGNHHQMLNVNADTAASDLAALLHADQLVLLTDVCGVKVHQQMINHLNYKYTKQLIQKQEIKNGMVPKVKAAFYALQHGVHNVFITNSLKNIGTKVTL
ncbi:acetylglutamate kinase [Philodulcilactobacillus myokoensis]|uniref:acetylglutamate kinase n=1 Tax=Philodulcilactobacillus myokoensis TaxID=2929573 RepID=A0A9W6ETS3_9LACO|nr:acetylglutamate kinase [Philodulcilactobacillus myokoensis]GLB47423.1 acetylglutamate kinase [Philodulcilactobacillus myokoensis]